ncbi:glutaredoxin 3 [Ciceribacter naphthalenivorans]|uniref:Glutaredoxin n=2 Tax=Alphaproteobacteria TaxID=28211 RepID=A0A512HLM4_9HYPH|nr:glutaredoxin 3 [Ciceribacter naphthalenivorans]
MTEILISFPALAGLIRPENNMASVTIYTRQGCGYCSRAKALLESKGVSYIEHDATGNPEMRQEMIAKSNGGMTFPQIFIGEKHVGGCDDLHALDRAGKLDALLAA